MSLFSVFWDAEAGVFLAIADLGAYGLETAVISAERRNEDGDHIPCGLFEVTRTESDLSNVIAITIPKDSQDSVDLRLELIGHAPQIGDVREDDDFVLFREGIDAPILTQTTKWTIAGDQLTFDVTGGQDSAPSDRISHVYLSPREGGAVYPAVIGASDGEGCVLEVQADFVASREDPERQMLEVILSTVENQLAMNTEVMCYTMSAVVHVLPLLSDENSASRVARDDNFCISELLTTGAGTSTLRFIAGRDLARNWDGYTINSGAPKMVDILDRLIIETSPPATLLFRDAKSNLQQIGKKGVAVLALGPREFWYVDNGRLVDRILSEERSFSNEPPNSFPAVLSENGLKASVADLERATEITVFAFASTVARLPNKYAPRSSQVFIDHAALYTAISLQSEAILASRDMMNVGRALRDPERYEPIRELAKAVLSVSSRVGASSILAKWVDSDNTNEWSAYAAALDDSIKLAANAGILLSPDDVAQLYGSDDYNQKEEFRQLSRSANMLIKAGIVSEDDPNFLEGLDRLEARKRRFATLRKNALSAISSITTELGPFELLPNTEKEILDWLMKPSPAVEDCDGPMDRISQFFAEKVNELCSEATGAKPQAEFSMRFGRILRWAIDDDACKIERLVKGGLSDPVELSRNNVLSMGLAEQQVGFSHRLRLDDSLIEWMTGEDPAPAIVVKWRRTLNKAYKAASPSASSG